MEPEAEPEAGAGPEAESKPAATEVPAALRPPPLDNLYCTLDNLRFKRELCYSRGKVVVPRRVRHMDDFELVASRHHNEAACNYLLGWLSHIPDVEETGDIVAFASFVLEPGQGFFMPALLEDALANLRAGRWTVQDPDTGKKIVVSRNPVGAITLTRFEYPVVIPPPEGAPDDEDPETYVYSNVWCVGIDY